MSKVTRRLAICALVALALTGCDKGNGIINEELNNKAAERFEYSPSPGDIGWTFGYVVDTETGVTYLVFNDNGGRSSVGGITPLLNRDGTPVIDGRYE